MNAMIMSALAAFGIAGTFGGSGSPDLQKAMDECCARRTDDCCTKKPGNCCVTKPEGCCEKMKDECCTWSSVQDGKRIERRSFCEHGGRRVMCGDKSGECSTCLK